MLTWACAQVSRGQSAPVDDHQNMMDQLGIKSLRSGPNPRNPGTFDEANANPYANTMPDVLTMKDGAKVTSAAQWPARRAEIAEDFEREVYGRIPANVPGVTWKVTATTQSVAGGLATVTRTLVGEVDNSGDPDISVNIQATLVVPANQSQPVPVMIEFAGFGPRPRRSTTGTAATAPATRPTEPAWHALAIANGWGYALLVPASIQEDNNHLTRGIIGLTNHGNHRTPEQWGALRAWQWGASRLIDCFEMHRGLGVDATKVGIEGLSRYGKAALVTEAFEPRIAVGLIGSSGEGGAKLHRHIFGEAVENLAAGEYYWMAGNFMKYGAADPVKTAAALPVDSHELIALCAPRPCFLSHGVVEHGDPQWIDAHGSFMAAVLASPVYELLGAKGLGTPGNYLTDPMPPPLTLIGGQLAWRQHEGGHDVTPSWPAFFQWVKQYVPEAAASGSNARTHEVDSAAVASPRTDVNSMLAHQQLVAKAKAGGIDLYFLGDSITRRWGCTDPQWSAMLANWRENFYGWNAADFGWGGDRLQNILWRVQNGELDGVHPKVIVILAGTNNVGNRPGGAEMVPDILSGFDALLATCRQKAPAAKIVLMAIFPRNDNTAVLPEIEKINEGLSTRADGMTIFYLNVNASLADAEGKLFDGMTVDKLHPTVKGYQVWADGLRPLLTQLLGPRAATDHAPPATGDPSAVHAGSGVR
jgi:lysophospholipase L1-like esterase